MSRKNQKTLPVSQKAYQSFEKRIHSVFSDHTRRRNMMNALDRYLDGDRTNYASDLDECCSMAFEMLRYEIDKAMERSARARRPRKSKEEVKVEPILTFEPEDDPQDETPVIRSNPSRRSRRALAQALRPKYKWKKIG